MNRHMQRMLNKVGFDNACQGKIPYPTIDAALKAKGKMEKKKGHGFNAYQCIWCRKYHIGRTLGVRKEENG